MYLRNQIYLVCQNYRLSIHLPSDLEHELDLISDHIYQNDHIKYNAEHELIKDSEKEK